ncbi:MAG TPA: response regulator [Flavisolibacter sp.]|nr:response regulator [Flavisolibacter sp.]
MLITNNTNSASPITVLLAEDDVDDQELLKEAFTAIDPAIQLHSFSSGKKFVDRLDSLDTIPRLIILDYNIPEMNGAEILEYINQNEQYSSVIKIVWSTSNSPLYKNSCLALGAHAYFVKPSTLSHLQEMAKKMLSYIS